MRVAMIAVHTSPLDQPGTGDAGGLNVYLVGLATALAARGVQVEILTRATAGRPEVVPLVPGVQVRHLPGGPERTAKVDLVAHLESFVAAAVRLRPPDVVHSHYWLAGLAGAELARRWGVPLVHSMHTLAKVKNEAGLPEPAARVRGEEAVVAAAQALVANTPAEADDLIDRYGADPAVVHVVEPGVDTDLFSPGVCPVDAAGLALAQRTARRHLGLPAADPLVLFAGRVQPLKGADVLIRALPRVAARLVVLGGPSGDPRAVTKLRQLAEQLQVADRVELRPPVDRQTLVQWYRAADVVAVPSRSESFGLVAAEAQACGTPVVAAGVGGLRTVVCDGVSGVLVPGHDPACWAQALSMLLADPQRREHLAVGGYRQGLERDWGAAAVAVTKVYEQAADRRAAAAHC